MIRKDRVASAVRVLAGAVGVLLALSSVVLSAQAASAAPIVTYPNAVSNISITHEDGSDGPLNQWDAVRITADWSVPDGATAGQTFGMTLPPEFSNYGAGDFEITDPETGEVMATCVIASGSAPEVVCTLAESVSGREQVGGSFWISVTATESTTEESVEFEVGDTIEIVDLPGEGGIIPEDLTASTSPYKYSSTTDVEGRIVWTVGIPGGFVQDGAFEVHDRLDPSLENQHYTGEIWLAQRSIENGQLVGSWTTVDPANYTAVFDADMKSFDFEAHGVDDTDVAYRLSYSTDADGVVLNGDVFGNTALVNTTETHATHTVASAGGGVGAGAEYARFTLTKALIGAQAQAAQEAVFTVRYHQKGDTAEPKTMSLRAGQTVRSDRIPLGTTFVIEEINFPAIAGVEWGAWTLSGDGVVAANNGTFEVTPTTSADVVLTLTNDAKATLPQTGRIQWDKVDPDGTLLAGSEWNLTGPSGVIAVVDNGAHDADPAVGSLAAADLEFGEYTLTETKSPAGYERTLKTFTAVVDADHLTATFGEITNVATRTPGASGSGGTTLAITGGEPNQLIPLLALVLLGSGAIALGLSRRRRTRGQATGD